jgi:hypothetical protein
MKWNAFLLVAASALCAAFTSAAATHYVDLNNPAPASPYTNWVSAATNIQDAVDAAVAGELILVTNGVYQTGARAVYGMSNRVAVTKAVTVQSVNGPGATTIAGYQVPGTTNGAVAVRCVYLANGAVLSGFTLTNGATQTANDSYQNQSGGAVWCESASGVVTNCVLTGNSANVCGGGAYYGTLNNSALTGNSGNSGGGAYSAMLNNCTLTGNYGSGGNYGGGAYSGTLNNCTLTGNSAYCGGGAYSATLNNCTLTGNYGSGAYSGTLNNCTLTGNSAGYGGGVNYATLNNCTLTGNSAGSSGGGTYRATLNNCIVYYNTAPSSANYYSDASGRLNYCCTTPLPTGGTGNRTDEPQLASTSHLSAGSPCRGAGSAAYTTGRDIDGEPWANPPSIGCDEYWSGSVTGAVSVTIVASYTYVPPGFTVNFQALMDGRLSASRWDFGDGVVVSNRLWTSHSWPAAGDYVVELRAYNESYPDGVAASVTVRVTAQPVHYVSLSSPAPAAPYSSWDTAATNIQDAVDAAVSGALIWVSNGVYQAGARAVYGMSNRVALAKAVTVQSVNGPGATTIVGYGPNGPAAVRCVYMTNGAVLSGFTLTNGATQTANNSATNQAGGGVWCEFNSAVVTNCVLSGNTASYGGGTFYGTINNCTLTGNSASQGGGGTYYATLNNCTLSGNSANGPSGGGGGAAGATLNNCTLTANWASRNGGGASGCTLNNCTVTGNWASGFDNTQYYGGGGGIHWHSQQLRGDG